MSQANDTDALPTCTSDAMFPCGVCNNCVTRILVLFLAPAPDPVIYQTCVEDAQPKATDEREPWPLIRF